MTSVTSTKLPSIPENYCLPCMPFSCPLCLAQFSNANAIVQNLSTECAFRLFPSPPDTTEQTFLNPNGDQSEPFAEETGDDNDDNTIDHAQLHKQQLLSHFSSSLTRLHPEWWGFWQGWHIRQPIVRYLTFEYSTMYMTLSPQSKSQSAWWHESSPAYGQ